MTGASPQELAQMHRPLDAPTLRAAAIELAQRGLLPRDVASALGISETAVRQLLAWEAS